MIWGFIGTKRGRFRTFSALKIEGAYLWWFMGPLPQYVDNYWARLGFKKTYNPKFKQIRVLQTFFDTRYGHETYWRGIVNQSILSKRSSTCRAFNGWQKDVICDWGSYFIKNCFYFQIIDKKIKVFFLLKISTIS